MKTRAVAVILLTALLIFAHPILQVTALTYTSIVDLLAVDDATYNTGNWHTRDVYDSFSPAGGHDNGPYAYRTCTGSGCVAYVHANYHLPAVGTVTHVTGYARRDDTYGGYDGDLKILIRFWDENDESPVSCLIAEYSNDDSWHYFDFDTTGCPNYDNAKRVQVYTGQTRGGYGGTAYARLDDVTLTLSVTVPDPIDPLVQPIEADERLTHYPIVNTNAGSEADTGLITRASSAHANVRAITDGTVISIAELDPADCNGFFFGNGLNAASFDCPMLYESDVMRNVATPADVIMIESDNSATRYVQLVKDATDYVIEGQTVKAGCWLGKPVQAQKATGTSVSITATWSFGGSGFDTVAIDNIPPAPEPPPSSPCHKREGFQECLGDYDLNDPSQWTTHGTVMFGDPAIAIFEQSEIIGQFNLDASREPELIVGDFPHYKTLTLQLGQTTIQTALDQGKASIPAGTHQPDIGEFYTVRVKFTGVGILGLDYICVRHTKDTEGGDIPPDIVDPGNLEPGEAPPPDNAPENVQTCTFANNSFDDGTESWTVSSGVESDPGAIHIPDAGTISQDITTSETATLSVIASVWSYNTYNPDPTDTSTIKLEYDTGSGYTEIETKTLGEYAARNGILVMQATVPAFSGTISLKPTLTGTPADVRGITIKSICINPDDSIITDDEGELDGGIFTAQCNTTIATASGDNLFSWIPWLWSHLNKFFQCDLMILLNNLYRLAVDAFNLAGWAIRYFITLFDAAIDWLGNQFIHWLGGYLSNISPGQVVLQQEEECNNLFCAITAMFDFMEFLIDTIANVLNTIIDAISKILQIGLEILAVLFESIALFQQLFNALVDSFLNAPAVEIPYLPQCSTDPKGNGLCIGLWMLENTILSGTGALFIPLLISYSGIMWLLWAVWEIKRTILDTGRGL